VVKEVLVLADDDGLLAAGALPDHGIIGVLQTEVEDMRGHMTVADHPVCQRGWEQ